MSTPTRYICCVLVSLLAIAQSGSTLYAQGDYPYASKRLVSYRDIESLDLQQLKIMRNEIYARHGCIFTAPDLIEHFAKAPWYRGTMSDVTSKLSDIERINIEHIKHLESARVAPQNVIGGIQLARKSKKLQHNGIPVRNVVTFMQYQTYQGAYYPPFLSTDGWALVIYEDKLNSWAVYELELNETVNTLAQKKLTKPEQYDDWDYVEGLKTKLIRGLKQEQVIDIIEESAPVMRGQGALPEVGLGEAMSVKLHGKVSTFPAISFFGDSIVGQYDWDSENDCSMLLPSWNTPGRVSDSVMKQIISYDMYHLMYRTPYGGCRWYQASLAYRPAGTQVKTVTFDSSFVSLIVEDGKHSWYLYSSRYPDGKVISIPPSARIEAYRGTELTETMRHWTHVLAIGYLEGQPRFLIHTASGALYTLPSATTIADPPYGSDRWAPSLLAELKMHGNVDIRVNDAADGGKPFLEVYKDDRVVLRIQPE